MIVAIIPAKGGSSRLPNKNMHPVNGKPMLLYSLEYAKNCSLVDEIYVSTDSDEIAAYSEEQGVRVIRRGKELGGETPIVKVYHHAITQIDNSEITHVVGIQPDHPDRTVDLENTIKTILEKDYEEIISVDGQGVINGSLKIMNAKALLEGKIGAVATIMDDCTNIHYMEDLLEAEKNLK